jgi:hypothetical protein
MITLDDCIELCEMPRAVVEDIAGRSGLPMVLACARAHGLGIGANDACARADLSPAPSRLAA